VRGRRVGGVSVRAAVLDQLSREAAEEGAGVEGAMSTPYVLPEQDPDSGGGASKKCEPLHDVLVDDSVVATDAVLEAGTAVQMSGPSGGKQRMLQTGASPSLSIGDPLVQRSTDNSLSAGLQPTSSIQPAPTLDSRLGSLASAADGESRGRILAPFERSPRVHDTKEGPMQFSGYCACDCVLHAQDADVIKHRARLDRTYARDIRRVTEDFLWQPLEWRGMLRLAVSGSGVAGEAPAQVLWSDVTDVESMSRLQLVVAWLSIRAEVVAVRLGRAWETRFRRWNVLFVVGVMTAALINARNYAGPLLRCRLQDASGNDYFDFCDE